MADPLGFLRVAREEPPNRPRDECIRDYGDPRFPSDKTIYERQSERCLECGVPFCEIDGCPAGNRIQDWVSLACGGKWKAALDILHSTDNFPEITGRLCIAPCERACILSINFSPVAIREIEREIADRAWREGWIVPEPSGIITGRRIAIIGSGPAGLAAAQQLARRGHTVTVFDRDDRIGGILRYGIPDFSLEKKILDRRIDQLVGEGVVFETGVVAGVDLSIAYLKRSFDAVAVFSGAGGSKDIDVPDRALDGIFFAMDCLVRQNRINSGNFTVDNGEPDAREKRVVIVGGGETAAYCVGLCRRQGASTVTVLEPIHRDAGAGKALDWREPPVTLLSRLSGDPLADDCTRVGGVEIDRFEGNDGRVRAVIAHVPEGSRAGVEYGAEMVILALGFECAGPGQLIRSLSIDSDERKKLKTVGRFTISAEGVFAADDYVPGENAVAYAITRGRRVAAEIDRFLSEGAI